MSTSDTCASGTDVQQLLEQQSQVRGILEERRADLDTLAKTVDQTTFQQTREAQIKKNERERTEVSNRALIVFAVTFAIVLICVCVRFFVDSIPLGATSALIMIAVVGGGALICKDLLLLRSRDRSNFQELALVAPNTSIGGTAASVEIKNKDATTTPEKDGGSSTVNTCAPIGSCLGAKCCDDVTNKWDAASAKCIPILQTTELFTQVRRPGVFTVPPGFNPKPCPLEVGKYD